MRDIDSDVSSINLSRTNSLSSRSDSTFAGIGSVSGKAIMSVGQLVIRSLEGVTIRKRLKEIGDQLALNDPFIPPGIYNDLLEFQRYIY